MIDIKSLNLSPLIELRFHLTNAETYSKLLKYETALYHFEKAREIIQKLRITTSCVIF